MPEIVTRAEALRRGLLRYFDGRACKRGHISERYARTKNCIACQRKHATDAEAWNGRFICDEEVDEYLGGETLHCLLCWQLGLDNLNTHLKQAHGSDHRAYRIRFGIPVKRPLLSRRLRETLRARSGQEQARVAMLARHEVRRAQIDWDAALARIEAGEIAYQVRTGLDGMPSPHEWRSHLRRDPAFAARSEKAFAASQDNRLLNRADWDGALELIRSGAKVKEIIRSGRAISKSMPSEHEWHRRRSFDPQFKALAFAATRQRLQLSRPGRVQLDRFAPERFKEQFAAALRSDEIYAAVHDAVRRLPHEIRDDVASDLVVAVLDGEVAIGDLAREVGRYRTAHNKMFGIWTPSLDAPIGDGGFTLGSSLAAAYV